MHPDRPASRRPRIRTGSGRGLPPARVEIRENHGLAVTIGPRAGAVRIRSGQDNGIPQKTASRPPPRRGPYGRGPCRGPCLCRRHAPPAGCAPRRGGLAAPRIPCGSPGRGRKAKAKPVTVPCPAQRRLCGVPHRAAARSVRPSVDREMAQRPARPAAARLAICANKARRDRVPAGDKGPAGSGRAAHGAAGTPGAAGSGNPSIRRMSAGPAP